MRVSDPIPSRCPACGAERRSGSFCAMCGAPLEVPPTVGTPPEAAAPPEAASPAASAPRRGTVRVLLLAGAALLALLVLVVGGLFAGGLVFGNEQRAQDEIIAQLGPPSRFILAYLPRTEDGADEIVRTEFWYYPDHRQRIAFVEGRAASVEDIDAEPDDATYLGVSPQDFDFTMGYEEVVAALGEKAEKVEDLPDLEARDGLAMYVTDHAMFAIERGSLVYLQTIGLSGTAATEGGTSSAKGRLYPVFIGEKWGFIDASGDIVVQPRFSSADAMSEGLAAVSTDGERYGFIGADGKTVIQPRFASVGAFHEGLAGAADGDLFGFIDMKGRWAIKPSLAWVGDFGEGLAPFSDGEKWGYIDRKGAVAIPPRFELADTFSAARAAVREGGKWGYIDTKGAWVIEPTLTSAGRFSDWLAPASTGDRLGYIDRNGTFVIEQRYLDAQPFSEGLAKVTTDEGAGFIDRFGKWAIKPAFDDAGPFLDGIAAVWTDGKLGYIDERGTSVWTPGERR